jgi:phosphatidylglycerol:prolipoprotein diacylglycerol transferase
MHPDLFTIPIFDWPVRSYGAMLTLGFLSGVWLSMKRAERLKADPDMILNIGFVCLLCGVAGARIFYVIHYWESSFARQGSPLTAALDCTGGGLEFYGGLIGAMVGSIVYMAVKRVSMRMYLDILAPAAIWGLAFGRMGCLLNGCCWGGVCVDAHGHEMVPWGITFPHGSSPQVRQWENRQLTLPAELIVTDTTNTYLLSESLVDMPIEEREGPEARVRRLKDDIRDLKAVNADPSDIKRLETQLAQATKSLEQQKGRLSHLDRATQYPSRVDPSRRMTVSELSDLAHQYRSLKVHPAQVYGIINALLLSWVLLELLYHRKRHGVGFAALCMIYPITRIILETVRVDNPQDTVGLTISQAVSVGMFLLGLAMLLYLRRLPERSPRAVPFVPPPVEEPDGRT